MKMDILASGFRVNFSIRPRRHLLKRNFILKRTKFEETSQDVRAIPLAYFLE